jgi:hypothetical protein
MSDTRNVICRARIKKHLFFQKKACIISFEDKQKSTKKRQKARKKKFKHNKINKTPFLIENYYVFPKTKQPLYIQL